MSVDERKRIASRIAEARRNSGLTQRGLAELLGVTVRSVQNYESGAVIPYKHLRRIETIARKRSGWLLQGEETDGELNSTIAALHQAMERQETVLQDHLRIMRVHTERLREQREASEQRRADTPE